MSSRATTKIAEFNPLPCGSHVFVVVDTFDVLEHLRGVIASDTARIPTLKSESGVLRLESKIQDDEKLIKRVQTMKYPLAVFETEITMSSKEGYEIQFFGLTLVPKVSDVFASQDEARTAIHQMLPYHTQSEAYTKRLAKEASEREAKKAKVETKPKAKVEPKVVKKDQPELKKTVPAKPKAKRAA
jgi:hypothetical protein